MTDPVFFDCDCLSAFLWVGNENLLIKLYSGKMYIPMQVYDELSHPYVPHLKSKMDYILSANHAKTISINYGTEAFSLYYQLTEKPAHGKPVIGKGEASALALAKTYNGIIASNNLKDISLYISEFNLKHITTGDIMCNAYEKEYITEEQGNIIWESMLAKRRKLGALSFSEYLCIHKI